MSDLPTILRQVPLESLLIEVRRRRLLIEEEEAAMESRQAWQAVTRAVAAAWGMPAASLWRPGRTLSATYPRQAAMVLMRERLGMTQEDIAAVFNKTHATVIHALETQQTRMQCPAYRAKFEKVKAELLETEN